jgi:catechol 2,3-dioxygenase-like lactoylglutathione lyase family enzyme
MPIDHLMLKVKDWAKAKAYYSTALKPLGYEPVADWGTGGGFGVAGQSGNIYVKQGASTLIKMLFRVSLA